MQQGHGQHDQLQQRNVIDSVGKFRRQLIELTNFKPKLLIRFIMNKTC